LFESSHTENVELVVKICQANAKIFYVRAFAVKMWNIFSVLYSVTSLNTVMSNFTVVFKWLCKYLVLSWAFSCSVTKMGLFLDWKTFADYCKPSHELSMNTW